MVTVNASSMLLKRWEKKELVQSLRHQGLSYREILSQVPFSLSRGTISNWCKEIELTVEQLDRLDGLFREGSYRGRLLGPKATQHRRAEEIEAIKAKARSEASGLSRDRLWLTGLMLYWAEGSKTYDVSLSNSDPALMQVAMRWFREVCHVPEEKFRVQLHLHSGQDESAMKAFWANVLELPQQRFMKTYVKREGTGHRKNILYHGTIRLSVSNRNLLHQIHGWIEGFCELSCGPLA